ncbi:MAG: DUF58 domain-containing protein [Oleispira sp.]|nr:DUF58 domain-containing protein [Oleispira sp.]MBL4882325.1 DUF58 domain-containing protein [Oleispira sp.]
MTKSSMKSSSKSRLPKRSEDGICYTSLKQLVALQHPVSGFSFLPKQPVQSILSGRHGSRLRGRGLNFEELRHYRPGDDIRTLDWKVTNRTGKPHVRVYSEEKERPVLILVDQRINMFFGSQIKMKSVLAAELAALSAWRVLTVGDRVGAIIFNDTEIKQIRPQRSRNNVMQILHHLVSFNHQLDASTSRQQDDGQLNKALAEVERISGHDYLIVLISDMSGWDDETLLRIKRLRQHNDVIASLVFDPLEQTLPKAQQLILSDGNQQIQVDSNKATVNQEFQQIFSNQVSYLKKIMAKYDIPVIPLTTNESALDQVRKALGFKMAVKK